MAKLDRFLRGIVGPVVFYELNGKQVARSRPSKVRLSEDGKRRAENFSYAARLASILVGEVSRLLPLPKFNKTTQRLIGAICRWLDVRRVAEMTAQNPVPWVENFSFNGDCIVNNSWKRHFRLVQDGVGNYRLRVDAFFPVETFYVPPSTKFVCCRIAVVSCHVENKSLTQVFENQLEIPYTVEPFPVQEIETGIVARSGELTIAVASLLFKEYVDDYSERKHDSKWRAVEMVGAVFR